MRLIIKIQINTSSGVVNQRIAVSGSEAETQEVIRRLQAHEPLNELKPNVHFRLPPIGACRHLSGELQDATLAAILPCAA